jgi:AraC-like DNA-binding protein
MKELPISILNLKIVAEAVAMMGLQVPPRAQKLLDQSDLHEGREDWLSSRQLDEFYQDMVSATGMVDFGLQLACSPALARYGIMPMLLVQTPTLRQALENILKFAQLLQDGKELDLIEGVELTRIVVEPYWSSQTGKVCRSDFIALGLTHVLRLFGGGSTGLVEVSFDYPAPTDTTRYKQLFDAPVKFDAPVMQLVFKTSMLSTALSGADPILYSAMLERANMALAEIKGRQNIVSIVSQEIVKRLTERPRMADIALGMRTTERTLRRQLIAAGADYQQLLVKLQMERACTLLADGQLSIQQVAGETGFSNVSSFHRAFLRWKGITPRAWQLKARGKSMI